MADFDFVQVKMGTVAVADCDVTFDSTPAAGNTIVVFAAAYSETNPPTVSDNQGNTYDFIVVATNTLYMFYAHNINASGTFTVTAHHTDGGNISAAMAEFEGDLTLDRQSGLRLDSSAVYSSDTTATTTHANELLVGAAAIFLENNASVASGFTERLAPTTDGSVLFYSIYSQVVSAVDDYILFGTNTSTLATWATLGTFYATAPAGGTFPGYISPFGYR